MRSNGGSGCRGDTSSVPPCRGFRDLSAAESGRLTQQKHQLLCDIAAYPDWLRPLLGNYGPRGASSPKTAGTAWKEIHNTILDRIARVRCRSAIRAIKMISLIAPDNLPRLARGPPLR